MGAGAAAAALARPAVAAATPCAPEVHHHGHAAAAPAHAAPPLPLAQRDTDADCGLALVLHRSGGLAAAAAALAAPLEGPQADADESPLRALLRAAVPGLDLAATPAALLSALGALLSRCAAGAPPTAPARGVGASTDLSHALALLSTASPSASAAGADASALPPALLRLLSPFAASFVTSRPLGRGGFGTVLAAVGAWDGRAVALKRVPFRSRVPPWAPPAALAAAHAGVLREARALAALQHRHVARYHGAWVEPRWDKLAAALTATAGGTAAAAGARRAHAPPRRQRSALRIREASASSSSDDESDDDGGGYSQTQGSDESSNSSSSSSSSFGGGSSGGYSHSNSSSSASALTLHGRLLLPPAATPADGLTSFSYASAVERAALALAPATSSSSSSGSSPPLLPLPSQLQVAPPALWPYTLYLSMELIPGPTLQRWLTARAERLPATGAPLAPADVAAALRIAAQLAHGVAHMHARGVLHRDLKPANVMLAPAGRASRRPGAAGVHDGADGVGAVRAVIVDLGLAAFAAPRPGRARRSGSGDEGVVLPDESADDDVAAADCSSAASASASADGHTRGVGTATYAAPEQVAGRAYGPPADVYSLGLILVELLCPFRTGMERAAALAAARAGGPPAERMDAAAPGSAALAAAMLAPDPAARPSAAAVARAGVLAGKQDGDDVAALRKALQAKEAELAGLRARLHAAEASAPAAQTN